VDPKPGIKTTEFWIGGAITLPPILELLGWTDMVPKSDLGEFAAWLSIGLVASVYIWTRAWVKIHACKEHKDVV